MIEKFDKQNLQTLRAEINAAIETVVTRHGLGSGKIGNIKYSDNEFRCKLTVSTKTIPKLPIPLGEIKVGDSFRHKRTIFTVTVKNNDICVAITDRGKHYRIKAETLSQMEKIN